MVLRSECYEDKEILLKEQYGYVIILNVFLGFVGIVTTLIDVATGDGLYYEPDEVIYYFDPNYVPPVNVKEEYVQY